ncbi:tyrosine-protein phosphatase [Streptomyces sp. NPDC002067]
MTGTRSAAPGTRVVPGAPNARDLAGLRDGTGRRVRPGLLYRGAGPAVGPLADRTGLRLVVDLRDHGEVDAAAPYPGVTVLSRPLVADRAVLRTGGAPQPSQYLAYYRQVARLAAPVAAELVGVLAAPERLPLMVCCSAGKDRTSVVCALTLRALGVRRADLARDHALTGRLFRRDPDTVRALPWARGLGGRELAARTAAPASVIWALLSGLEREYGSVGRLLHGHGLRPETARRARAVILGTGHPLPSRKELT